MLSVFFIVCVCVDMCYKIVLKMCLNMYILMVCAIVVCCCCDVFFVIF